MKRTGCLLLVCLLLLGVSCALAEDVTLTVGGESFSAPADAESIDLGALSLPDTDEAYTAFSAFLARFPKLTHVDMFSTDIRQNRLEALAEQFPGIEFGWTIYIPCKNKLRPDRGAHRLRTDQTAFSTLHNISCTAHDESVWRMLKYCKNLLALDIGHNNKIRDLSFLYDLPQLKVLILSFNGELSDITPIGSLKDLEYLEICKDQIRDISPLASCTKLMDLNICTNRVQDLTPLYGLKSLRRLFIFSCQNYSIKPTDKAVAKALQEALPDCVVDNAAINIDGPWRQHPRYETVKAMFGFGVTQTREIIQTYIPFTYFD